MAIYQADDIIMFHTNDRQLEFAGRILGVAFDAPQGSGRISIYDVLDDENDTLYEVNDAQIIELLDGPTRVIWDADGEDDTFDEPTDIQAIPPPINRVSDDIEITGAVRRARRQDLEVYRTPPTHVAQNPPEEQPDVREIREAAEQFAGQLLTEHQEDNFQDFVNRSNNEHEELLRSSIREREIRKEAQLLWGQVRGERFINPLTVDLANNILSNFRGRLTESIPDTPTTDSVPPANEGRITRNASDPLYRGRITIHSYNPKPVEIEGGNLYKFRVTQDTGGANMMLSPHFEDGRYVFRNEEGVRYVNQYQDSRVNAMRSHLQIVDVLGVNWGRWELVEAIPELQFGGKKPSKPKKKLYRKHPIPEIKDEKYYAGKEFIA